MQKYSKELQEVTSKCLGTYTGGSRLRTFDVLAEPLSEQRLRVVTKRIRTMMEAKLVGRKKAR